MMNRFTSSSYFGVNLLNNFPVEPVDLTNKTEQLIFIVFFRQKQHFCASISHCEVAAAED